MRSLSTNSFLFLSIFNLYFFITEPFLLKYRDRTKLPTHGFVLFFCFPIIIICACTRCQRLFALHFNQLVSFSIKARFCSVFIYCRLVCVSFTAQLVKRPAPIIVGGWLKSEKLNLCTNPDWIYLFVCFPFSHESAPT